MAERVSQFNVQLMVEDVLQQNGKRLSEDAALRRYEAARWLRKMVGVVLGKDLPAEPSEDDFKLGLRSGIILCSALNKVQPGSVPKIVEAPSDIVSIYSGAPITSFPYLENVRNFLVGIEQLEIPMFEPSDLDKGGGDLSRIVKCVLGLKSYHEWKKNGGNGQWKFDETSESPMEQKQTIPKSSDFFLEFMSKSSSDGDLRLIEGKSCSHPVVSHTLHKLICQILADKNRQDIPLVVEHMLGKVMEEFEHRLAAQNGHVKTTPQDKDSPSSNKTMDIEIRATPHVTDVPNSPKIWEAEICTTTDDKAIPGTTMTGEMEIRITSQDENVSKSQKTTKQKANLVEPVTCFEKKNFNSESKGVSLKCVTVVERQHGSIRELKHALHFIKEEMRIMQMKYQEQAQDFGKHLNFLANAASRYKKVLEENRKLYNEVQDLKGSIRVYLRVRPFLPGESNGSSVVDNIEDRNITLFTPSKNGKGKKSSFTFNRVFGPSSSQEEVFVDMQPLIRSVLDGYNVCIFAYGQTGSGKTFTMTGPKELTKESLGVNYRALNDLFLISEDRKDTISYEISVQMMEIYNEQVRDLLVTDGANKKLEIRNNAANGINVPNANLVPVTSPSDVINLMNLGHKNRAVGSTNMNDRSSRSHSCLTVHVQGKDITSGAILRGCMHLVDLAGSERADKTDATGDRLKEAQHINRSLSALGDVISSLAQKHSHVPYRNSKLTQLLQDSLGGQAKTLMFVHISPEPDALGETLSTLKFAERVSSVELGAAKANKDCTDVKELKEQLSTLKAALARRGDDEIGSLHHSVASSPDTWAVRSYTSSSSTASWNDIGDTYKIEEASNSTSRRHSFESEDFANSPSWVAPGSPDSMKEVKVNSIQSPKAFHQKITRSASKVHQNQSSNKVIPSGRRHSFENDSQTTTNFDEVETTPTSDSSEQDQQLHTSRSRSTPNATDSKIRKPTLKITKSQERGLIPQPTKKVSNGVTSPASTKTSRQPTSSAAKRKPGNGK